MAHPLTPARARWLFWFTLVVVSALAFMPGDDVPPITTGWDKSNHSLAFFVLTLLAALSWPKQLWWRLALAMVGYGVFIEIVQYFVDRDADMFDVVADSVGILIHGCIWFAAKRTLQTVS